MTSRRSDSLTSEISHPTKSKGRAKTQPMTKKANPESPPLALYVGSFGCEGMIGYSSKCDPNSPAIRITEHQSQPRPMVETPGLLFV